MKSLRIRETATAVASSTETESVPFISALIPALIYLIARNSVITILTGAGKNSFVKALPITENTSLSSNSRLRLLEVCVGTKSNFLASAKEN